MWFHSPSCLPGYSPLESKARIKSTFLCGIMRGLRGIVSPVSLPSTLNVLVVVSSYVVRPCRTAKGGTYYEKISLSLHLLVVIVERVWVGCPHGLIESLIEEAGSFVDKYDLRIVALSWGNGDRRRCW
jgi:hypothetical protein